MCLFTLPDRNNRGGDEMSKARDKYYIWKDEVIIPEFVGNYVSELEAEKAELIEFIEEIQSNYSIYTYEDFTAWSNKFDYYKLQKEN